MSTFVISPTIFTPDHGKVRDTEIQRAADRLKKSRMIAAASPIITNLPAQNVAATRPRRVRPVPRRQPESR
jgi:hypothetical protein